MDFLSRIAEVIVPAAQAHEKWFVSYEPAAYPIPEPYLHWNWMTISAAVVVAAAVAVGLWVDRRFERSGVYAKSEKKLRPYRDWVAGVVAITTGILLLWSTTRGVLIADNFIAPGGYVGRAFLALQGTVGLLLLIGFSTLEAAVGLLALYASLFFLYPPLEPLDYLYYAGIGVFLLAFARGRYSVDWFLGKPVISTPKTRKRAYFAMRVLTGTAFIMLAMGKWLHPDLHFALMDRFPNFNPYVMLQWVGIHLSRETYVFALFVIESLVGLFLLLGLLTRIVAFALVPIFVGSVLFLGPGELVGHLPILGILFALFIYGDRYHKGEGSGEVVKGELPEGKSGEAAK